MTRGAPYGRALATSGLVGLVAAGCASLIGIKNAEPETDAGVETTEAASDGKSPPPTDGMSAPDGPSVHDGGPLSEACQAKAQAVCAKMQSCDSDTLETAYGTAAVCESAVTALCVSDLSAPSTGDTPSQTIACAQAYAGYDCADYLNHANVPAACRQKTGGVPLGGACGFAAQCATGFCAIAPGKACGTCASTPTPASSCADLTSCGDTLTCTSDTLECVVPQTSVNGACGPGQPCGAGLSCVAGLGTCQVAGTAVGTACDRTLQTAPGCETALGLSCNGVLDRCRLIAYVAAGQTCGYNPANGQEVSCTAGRCVNGTCVAGAADGASCTVPDGGATMVDVGCMGASRCVTAAGAGMCQPQSGTCP